MRIGSPPPLFLVVQVHCLWTGTRPFASHLQAFDSRLWLALCPSPSRARVQALQRRQEEAATLQEHAEEYRQVAADKTKAAALARASAKREAERRAALRKQVSPRACGFGLAPCMLSATPYRVLPMLALYQARSHSRPHPKRSGHQLVKQRREEMDAQHGHMGELLKMLAQDLRRSEVAVGHPQTPPEEVRP